MTQIDISNQQFQNALNIIERTQNSLFLTGKAGTGKSTFLRHIDKTSKKKHVILAPTGIAAIKLNRRYIGIDNEKEYLDLSIRRYQEIKEK